MTTKHLTREELLNLRSLLIDGIGGKQAVREIIKKTGHSIYLEYTDYLISIFPIDEPKETIYKELHPLLSQGYFLEINWR